MARVRLKLPDSFPFETLIRVRVDDINYGGHLGNDSVLSLLHEARVRFLQHYGFTELDIGGAGTIMTDAVVMYLAEAFLGDIIRIRVTTGDFNKYGCDFLYQLDKNDGKEIARAKTGMVCFDYGARKMMRVPDVFIERCKFDSQKG